MKIVRIFADHLFAFHYENDLDNEFDRLMELWTDVAYLWAFAKKNKVLDAQIFVDSILQDAEDVQNLLNDLTQNNQLLGFYFEPLQDSERTKLLAFQKGKIRLNQLRYYAIKIDENCFVITGGAIKMSQKMHEHPDTVNELRKLEAARAFLNKNGVFDDGSFYELLKELS